MRSKSHINPKVVPIKLSTYPAKNKPSISSVNGKIKKLWLSEDGDAKTWFLKKKKHFYCVKWIKDDKRYKFGIAVIVSTRTVKITCHLSCMVNAVKNKNKKPSQNCVFVFISPHKKHNKMRSKSHMNAKVVPIETSTHPAKKKSPTRCRQLKNKKVMVFWI